MDKKLYYVANIRLPTEKAHGTQIMKMCEAFAEIGYEVELVIPNRKTDIKDDPFSYYGVKRNFKIRRLFSLDLIRFGKIGFIIQTLTFTNSALIYSLTKDGVFYTRDAVIALVLDSFKKRVGWEIHMERKNIAVRLVLKFGIPLVAITQGLKDLYISLGAQAENILVAHDGVDLNIFKNLPSRIESRTSLGLPQDKTIIAYIGKYTTLGESKGVEDSILPFKKLLQSKENAYLLIVGPEKDEARELEKMIKAASISSESYKIISRVPHTEQFLYMKAADLLLLMYPNTRHYAHFMSPLKLFDYMASGAAIISSDLPSLREVINDDSAYFFNSGNDQSLIDVLEESFNEDDRKSKAESAYQKVQEYAWEKRARSIIDFLV